MTRTDSLTSWPISVLVQDQNTPSIDGQIPPVTTNQGTFVGLQMNSKRTINVLSSSQQLLKHQEAKSPTRKSLQVARTMFLYACDHFGIMSDQTAAAQHRLREALQVHIDAGYPIPHCPSVVVDQAKRASKPKKQQEYSYREERICGSREYKGFEPVCEELQNGIIITGYDRDIWYQFRQSRSHEFKDNWTFFKDLWDINRHEALLWLKKACDYDFVTTKGLRRYERYEP
jgi:hypothetical protein